MLVVSERRLSCVFIGDERRGGRTATLEGHWKPTRLVILEFPDIERAKSWWSSTEYARAKTMRQKAAATRMVLLEGLPPHTLIA